MISETSENCMDMKTGHHITVEISAVLATRATYAMNSHADIRAGPSAGRHQTAPVTEVR